MNYKLVVTIVLFINAPCFAKSKDSHEKQSHQHFKKMKKEVDHALQWYKPKMQYKVIAGILGAVSTFNGLRAATGQHTGADSMVENIFFFLGTAPSQEYLAYKHFLLGGTLLASAVAIHLHTQKERERILKLLAQMRECHPAAKHLVKEYLKQMLEDKNSLPVVS